MDRPSVFHIPEDIEGDGFRFVPTNGETEIIVEVEGGLVQWVYSTQKLDFVEILDRDIEKEGASPEEEAYFKEMEQKAETMPFKY